MKATVKQISKENNSVLLVDADGAEQWFNLAEQVKILYVKLGEAEVTVDQEAGEVTYLKMEKAPQKSGFNKPAQKSFGQNPAKPAQAPIQPTPPEEEKKFYKTKHIVLENLTGEELRIGLDLASEQNWVIATQTHLVEGKWYAVIYYKVKPE